MTNPGKEKIAFVCQRYGLEVNGGAELYCRQVAEQLTKYYDVTVYTTCAESYVTWKDFYAPGEEMLNGVRVKRYPVDRERDPERFAQVSAKLLGGGPGTQEQEEEWLEEQGPVCCRALEAVKEEAGQYRAVFFMTYLYYLTAHGMRMNLDNAILIPTLHDEPPVYLRCYDVVFANARAIVWNAENEKKFANRRFPFLEGKPGDTVGIGIEKPEGLKELELPAPLEEGKYLVYAGRIDESKGCGDMIRYFEAYGRAHRSGLKLVLMGKEYMKIPDSPDIIRLGFVSEEMKLNVMASSLALVLFSRFESLSMVTLESMMMGRPVLVNGKSAVLKEHCVRSNAGLYFDNYPEFSVEVDYLLSHPDEYRQMRENGKRYVQENYTWDAIMNKYRQLINRMPE